MSGRSRSLAMTVFFKTELLGMNKVPHRSIVDLEAAPRLWPPILRGATLPVSWNRRTQLITVLGATPNRAATRCRDSPPSKTAATARSRRSIDKGLAIHAGLLSSQHVESDPSRFGNPKSILPKVIPL